MSTAQIRPALYLLSDYGMRDTGHSGSTHVGYGKDLIQFFPDLVFEDPDRIKVLETVQVEYESLRELPMTVAVFRGVPLGDAGTLLESMTLTTKASAGQEPGIAWGAAWANGLYATQRLFKYTFSFQRSVGKSLSVGLLVNVNLVPFRLVRVTFFYTIESSPQWGTGVLRTP